MKVTELNSIIENAVIKEIKRTILSEAEGDKKDVYHIKCEGVPLGTFDTEEEANEALPKYKENHDGELIIEKGTYNSHEDMMDKLDEMNDQLEETNDMENTEKESMEGNEFSGALKDARDAGEEEFEVGGETYSVDEELHGDQDKIDADKDGKISANDFKMLLKKKGNTKEIDENKEMCSECGGQMEEGVCNECYGKMKESKVKTLRLKESEMIQVIKRIVQESLPTLNSLEKIKKDTSTDTKEYMSTVEKQMKKQASFDGNDNPEFPKAISKGEKVATKNTEKEDEDVADNRGGGMEDLDFINEPSESFKKRLKMALEGDKLMGNSQDAANVIKTDTGKNILSKVLRKNKKEENAPMYNKDVQPVRNVNETSFKFSSILKEEIEKMKNIASYNKKTQ